MQPLDCIDQDEAYYRSIVYFYIAGHMAILRDKGYGTYSTVSLSYIVEHSEYYSIPGGEWVSVTIAYDFGEKFPVITTQSHGQEIVGVQLLVASIHDLIEGRISTLEFEPLEPDYSLEISHSGRGKFIKENNYHVQSVIDASNTHSGVYCGVGPALVMGVTREEMLQFAQTIQKELDEVVQKLPKQQ